MSCLCEFGDRLWLVDGDDVSLMSIPFSTRMTVIKLESGGLWLHSPVEPTPERCSAVDGLGTVEWLVAPNKIHSLGILPWKERYPKARVWVSPQFRARHVDIPTDGVLTEDAPSAWRGEIDQLLFCGSFFLDEFIFLHRRSRTLIVTDLIQRHDPATETWFWRQTKDLAGVLGEHGGTSRDLQWTFRDRAAARGSAKRLLGWDFDQLVISHGMCERSGAKRLVERALAWATGT